MKGESASDFRFDVLMNSVIAIAALDRVDQVEFTALLRSHPAITVLPVKVRSVPFERFCAGFFGIHPFSRTGRVQDAV